MDIPNYLNFDIAGAPLRLALAIPFETPVLGHSRVEAWSVDKDGKRLVLHWSDSDAGSKGIHPLPAALSFDSVVRFVEDWLSTVDYGPEPATDGSTEKSSRVYCEAWGQISGHGWSSFVAIEPHWLVYGK